MPRSLFLSTNQGTVIIVALWSLVILSVLAVAISNLVTPQIKLAEVVTERFAVSTAAQSALRYALAERTKDSSLDNNPDAGYDSLFELKAQRNIALGNANCDYRLFDEERKININTADEGIIMHLPGLEDARIVDNIISYRSNKPFEVLDELFLVEGMTEEIFAQFQDFITIYTSGAVNINTASETALAALGLGEDIVEPIMRYRKGDDREEATEDDKAFKNPGAIVEDLSRFSALTPEQSDRLLAIVNQGILATKSQFFSMELEVSFLKRKPYRFKIIFDSVNRKVLSWQED